MPKELANDETSLELLRVMQDFTSWFQDTRDYEDSIYQEKHLFYLESQKDYFEFMKTDFTSQIVESLNKLNSEDSKIDVTVNGLEGITTLSSLTTFLDSENIQVDDFVTQIDTQLNHLTSDVLPNTIYNIDNLNNELESSLTEFNELFANSSEELKANLSDMNSTVESYTNNATSTVTGNIGQINNGLSNQLGGVGRGLGSFIAEFAKTTSTALPVMGRNISTFFTLLSNPKAIAGIGVVTLATLGMGKGFDLLGDGVLEVVQGFDEFITRIEEIESVGDVALDIVKLAGGITTLNLALSGSALMLPASYVGLKALTYYIDELGDTYDGNKENLNQLVALFDGISDISVDGINLEGIDENLSKFIDSIPEVNLKASIDIVNLDEIQEIAVALTLDDSSLTNVIESVKQVEFSQIQPSINNKEQILNPYNENIEPQSLNDNFAMITELQNINRTLNNMHGESVSSRKETKREIERASFFGNLNEKENEVGILDQLKGLVGIV